MIKPLEDFFPKYFDQEKKSFIWFDTSGKSIGMTIEDEWHIFALRPQNQINKTVTHF